MSPANRASPACRAGNLSCHIKFFQPGLSRDICLHVDFHFFFLIVIYCYDFIIFCLLWKLISFSALLTGLELSQWEKTARFAGISAKQSEIPVSRASSFFIWQLEDFYKELVIEPRSRQTETARFAGLIFLIWTLPNKQCNLKKRQIIL